MSAEKLELEQNVFNLGKKLTYLNSLKKQLFFQNHDKDEEMKADHQLETIDSPVH